MLGTARVLRALELLDPRGTEAFAACNTSFAHSKTPTEAGAAEAVASSQEETALAVSALVPCPQSDASRRALIAASIT